MGKRVQYNVKQQAAPEEQKREGVDVTLPYTRETRAKGE
jgi:hypothetical protein